MFLASLLSRSLLASGNVYYAIVYLKYSDPEVISAMYERPLFV